MLFDIEPDSPTPIYEQIVARVTFAIAAGDIDAGTLIPSVRELADKLIVNPNTVARAFQELEKLGVITARRGRGMEVTPHAVLICQSRRQELIRGRIRDALRQAVSSSLPADEIRQLVEEELAYVNGHRRTREKR